MPGVCDKLNTPTHDCGALDRVAWEAKAQCAPRNRRTLGYFLKYHLSSWLIQYSDLSPAIMLATPRFASQIFSTFSSTSAFSLSDSPFRSSDALSHTSTQSFSHPLRNPPLSLIASHTLRALLNLAFDASRKGNNACCCTASRSSGCALQNVPTKKVTCADNNARLGGVGWSCAMIVSSSFCGDIPGTTVERNRSGEA